MPVSIDKYHDALEQIDALVAALREIEHRCEQLRSLRPNDLDYIQLRNMARAALVVASEGKS